MIRYKKAVRLLEWGEGTNTTNQIWSVLGEGQFSGRSIKDGRTVLTVQTSGSVSRKNQKDNTVKLAQRGEGMAANSEHWGEVAIGHIQSISGNTVVIEIPYATKISDAAGPIRRFFFAPGND